MDRLLRAPQASAVAEDYPKDSMRLALDAIVDIEEAQYIGGYKLHLLFSDGKERIVDFAPFLRNSVNPLIRKYLALDNFLSFSVEYGDLFWNDYDLCFPIADLYEGRI